MLHCNLFQVVISAIFIVSNYVGGPCLLVWSLAWNVAMLGFTNRCQSLSPLWKGHYIRLVTFGN